MDSTVHGLQVLGANGRTRIATTQFNHHEVGLLYFDQTTIIPQESMGNMWNEDNLVFDAEHRGGAAWSMQSIFKVHNTQQPNDASPTIASGDWFRLFGYYNDCTTFPDCGIPQWEIPTLTSLDTSVANGLFGNLDFGDMVQYHEAQRLYALLSENPNLLIGNSLMQGFKNTNDNSEIGQIYTINKDLKTLFNPGSPSELQMLAELDQIEITNSEIDSLYDLLDNLTGQDSLNMESTIETLSIGLVADTDNYWTSLSAFNQAQLSALLILQSDLNQISPISNQATEEKSSLTLLISFYLNQNSLSTTEQASLYIIASKCFRYYGSSVLLARALYEHVTLLSPDWDSIEGSCDNIAFRSENKTLNKAAVIYPNPVYGEYLNVSVEHDKELNYEIFDINGRIYSKGKLFDNINQVNISDLTNGVYMIKILKEKSIISTEKFVIINR